jgi:hypothetical protein
LSENILAIGMGISPNRHISLATVSESPPWIPAYFMAAAATPYEYCQPSGASANGTSHALGDRLFTEVSRNAN